MIGGVVEAALGVLPRLYRHEVGHVGRDLTLDDGRVAPDHVLVVRLCLVGLGHHWWGMDSYHLLHPRHQLQ